MAESILIEGTTRSEKYESLLNQLKILIGEEQDLISILSNTTAVLKDTFGFFWIGFYIVRGNVLKLGPFQGRTDATYLKQLCQWLSIYF